MAIEKVSITIKWNQKRRGKKLWRSKGFLSPYVCGDQKVFGHHDLMVVVTKFGYHQMELKEEGK
jgi:hypothetical protein